MEVKTKSPPLVCVHTQYGVYHNPILVESDADVPLIQDFKALDDDDEILEIFRFISWRNIPWSELREIDSATVMHPKYNYPITFYDRMKPALRLASIWIKRARPFWVHLYRGTVLPTGDGGTYLPIDFTPTDEDQHAFDEIHKQLTEDVRFPYRVTMPVGPGVINGTTGHMADVNPHAVRDHVLHIGIAQEIIYSLSLSNFYTAPQEDRETQLAHLAQLLVHEYAHAVWYSRNYMDRHAYKTYGEWVLRPEPPIFPAEWHELGYASCLILFGCQLDLSWPVDLPAPLRSGRGGLRAAYLSTTDWRPVLRNRRVCRETVHSMFNKATWKPKPDGTMRPFDMYLIDEGDELGYTDAETMALQPPPTAGGYANPFADLVIPPYPPGCQPQ